MVGRSWLWEHVEQRTTMPNPMSIILKKLLAFIVPSPSLWRLLSHVLPEMHSPGRSSHQVQHTGRPDRSAVICAYSWISGDFTELFEGFEMYSLFRIT